ncbi:PilT/PilU family type 4a pilus ATPase [Thauera linaloolentis]|uniref:Twitching motility protein n=1 Tax=Thauera linaloolentis (strain DSM 12138 / JCM 21573 / CCUG 41526 / CIP 105981 / IAM 15112 / NBRC 102519 / 47Lol) TaxID=1123367 RepID=N6Z7F5_THAL4|nr:PilT/PilU family type 4a pilus ATPase [Thauera linaloolentis]ENO90278.1 twitching motility protein [Thauera linaloolentis 47Lol = DSM 12138]MCM8566233.1 PilT/PilU family type 4a pilus ATPase [Thauera linaloolentis]
MIFDSLFQLMADKKASDIFITAGAPIHIKIQGNTMPINQQVMEPAMIRRMVEEAVPPEKLAQFDRERELNLSFGRRDLGNFRVNVFWQRSSIAVVARYIQGDIPTIHDLSLPEVLAEVVMEKRGLLLVVGATGSGKSTTLASMLDHRNRHRSGHILTVEDPIEYLFTHRKSVVNQREVGIDTLSWGEALRNAMRQAPDCILIGEIRDRETMQAAISYAQSGHLCLATLHANNAYHALNRIINFFPLENRQLLYLDLAVALRSIVSQRLVRKPDGGRVPAVEILMNTRHIAELIERGEINEIKHAMEQSLAPGCQTFEQCLYELYTDDVISLDEALANADSPTNLHWLINNAQINAGNHGHANTSSPPPSLLDFETSNPDGASFQEFTLHVDNN